MKEVERISLGGYAFTLDQDASALASEYLGKLESHYAGREGGAEILEGIEERMAELLRERCGSEGVGSRRQIEEIIDILGRPEDIEEGDGEAETGSGAARTEAPSPKESKSGTARKLYRDLSDKVVAGVCSGLGAYCNLDTALFRILFVAGTIAMALPRWHGHWAFHISFPLLYVILWICMPAAKTARQRWEQRGEDGTVNGIQHSVESGAREADRNLGIVPRDESKVSRVIAIIAGLILLIISFSGLFAGGVFSFGSGFLRGGFGHGLHDYGLFGLGRLYGYGMSELYESVPALAGLLSTTGMRLLLLLVVFLPFVGILYGALQLLFGFKSPKWHPGLVIFILWLLSVIATGILVAAGFFGATFLTV